MRFSGLLFVLSAIYALVCADLITIQGRQLSTMNAPKQWKQQPRASTYGSKQITFTIQLRECNMDTLQSVFWDVSNPKSDNYGKYLTLDQVNEMVSCSNEDMPALLNYINSFPVKKIQQLGSTAVKVTCTVSSAEKMLHTTFFDFKHSEKGTILSRQVGPVKIPSELAEIVSIVIGISEFFTETKYEAINMHEKRVNDIKTYKEQISMGLNPTANLFYDDQFVTPSLLKNIYGIPTTPLVEAGSTLGIAAFTDVFDENSLCRFQDLFNNYSALPNVHYEGSDYEADEVESDLDVQYSTAIALGVDETFHNQPEGNWIYDWAAETVQNDKRSLVWSISYGWPEIYQCMIETNTTSPGCSTGTDYQIYINATDNQLVKLGALGVSVLVSSGDDGSTGFSSNCPADPNQPYPEFGTNCSTVFAPNADGTPVTCGCTQVIFEMTSADNFNATCVWPTGYFFDLDNACSFDNNNELLLTCLYAMQGMAEQNTNECNTTLPFGEVFYSTCECSVFTPVTNTTAAGTCTASPYVFDAANGPAMFPDYPTSSPFVTSVGALGLLPTDTCNSEINKDEVYCTSLDTCAFSGGGGFSTFQPGFAAQQSAVQSYVQNNKAELPPTNAFDPTRRGYPDVALNGHNFMVAINQGTEGMPLVLAAPVGGTSASSPTFAGFVAHLNDVQLQNNRPSLGPLNQLLYTMASESPATFTDIVPLEVSILNQTQMFGVNSGCNRYWCCEYNYPVAEGWDAATGLGSPNFPAMVTYLDQMWAKKE